jgi:putative transposase
MADSVHSQIVLDALEMALRRRQPVDVANSDQGVQYTSLAFSRRLGEAGVAPSMGSPGDACDNALAESFWSTLDRELLWGKVFLTRAAARMALFDYIEGWFNSHRRHSSLGMLSPVEFERRWRTQIAAA